MDLADQLGIQRRGGFVQQHDLRVHCQRPGDRYPLLLAPGEFCWIFLHMIFQADPLQFHDGTLVGLSLRDSLHLNHADPDVLERVQVVEKVEVLKDHSDLLAVGVEVPLVVVMHLAAVQPNPPLVGFDEEIDALQQRAFPRTRGTDQDLQISLVYVEGRPLQNILLPIALRQVFNP